MWKGTSSYRSGPNLSWFPSLYFLSLPIGGSWVWLGYSPCRIGLVQETSQEEKCVSNQWKECVRCVSLPKVLIPGHGFLFPGLLPFLCPQRSSNHCFLRPRSWSLFHYSNYVTHIFYFTKILCNMTIICSLKFLVSHLPLSLALEEMFWLHLCLLLIALNLHINLEDFPQN